MAKSSAPKPATLDDVVAELKAVNRSLAKIEAHLHVQLHLLARSKRRLDAYTKEAMPP